MTDNAPQHSCLSALDAQDLRILAACPLFSGLQGQALAAALCFWDARVLALCRGMPLSREGQPQPWFGLVLRGAVEVSMDTADGRRMVMAAAKPGDTFGEALHYLGTDSAVQIRGVGEGRVLLLRCARLRQPDAPAEHLQRFAAMLAQRALRMNDRIQVLSRPTIREKVLTLLALQVRDGGERRFTLPFDREGMAAYLGVDRSALSRALSAMRRDGLIDYRGSSFTLLVSPEP